MIRFYGPIGNSSGYGNAVKNMARAFDMTGLPTKFMFGNKDKYNLSDYSGSSKIDFYMHAPSWTKHKSTNYKIAYFYWEADQLPLQWSKVLNTVNEIWAPCNLVLNSCKKLGFAGKLRLVPTPCNKISSKKQLKIPNEMNSYLSSQDTVFYSIFQWHQRKGYKELLTAYWKEFTSEDKVTLVLKVNPLNIAGNDLNKIHQDIKHIKASIPKASASVFLSPSILPEEYIHALHQRGDVFISAHHGEGWGMPIHDAMLHGKHIITTKFGGVTELLDDSSANIINHKLVPVAGMDWSPLYSRSQNWAQPNTSHLATLMRELYSNREAYNFKTENAKKIASELTIEKVSEQIKGFLT